MPFLQDMYPFHCCIQISVIVLQQKFSCISTEGTKKNTMQSSFMDLSVVATTRCNGTHSLLTSAKLTEGYLVVRITRELDKEPSLHCSFIYINYMWSMLQQYLLALIVKITEGGLNFYFSFSFYFHFIFIFNLFSIFRTRIRVK